MFYRQVGASRHFIFEVHRYRNARFPNSWEGRAGLTSWPIRSSDLVPLDDYVWEFVTDKYFVGLPTNIDDLRTRIAGAVVEVTPDLLHLEVTSFSISDITRNLICFATFICTLLLSVSFSKCLYPLKVVKLLLKHAIFHGTQVMLQ